MDVWSKRKLDCFAKLRQKLRKFATITKPFIPERTSDSITANLPSFRQVIPQAAKADFLVFDRLMRSEYIMTLILENSLMSLAGL